MEGYLLVFTKDRAAHVGYCVLEHGQISCYDRIDGDVVARIELTRHRVRVQPLLGGNVCPNRFVVYTTEVKRADQAGKLRATVHGEKTHFFAAATSDKMCKWVNAIHNWRRHSFDDPLRKYSGGALCDPSMTSADFQTLRRMALEDDRVEVLDVANRFDIRVMRYTTAAKKNGVKKVAAAAAAFPKISPISTISGAAARKVLLMRPSHASGALVSWLPSFPYGSRKSTAA
uniref:PH domain-containing protein n=1 Tax=Globisporangium ultimum (strain ATCC 200006 / CBS 805.95 / DAOM BR144) TaxID=431595 RepID=K3WYK0_GLOUD